MCNITIMTKIKNIIYNVELFIVVITNEVIGYYLIFDWFNHFKFIFG